MAFTWDVDRNLYPALPDPADPNYAVAVARQNANESLAVQIMWSLSGRQFGLDQVTARPCPPPPQYPHHWARSPLLDAPWIPVFWGGQWVNWTCGCVGRCTMAGPRAVHLTGPVASIVTVTIAGTVLDPGNYALEGDVLYRHGLDWPRQDQSRPLGDPHTWSVDYLKGYPQPAGVDLLTGILANELIRASVGDKCRLPRNITGVSRQGVSYQVYNPNQIFASGKTGLSEVDAWLAAVNPHAILSAPTVI